MRFVNRSVLVLRAKPPYVEWANEVGAATAGAVSLDDARQAGSAFLIPAIERDEEARAFVEAHARAMFEHELGMWMDDPDTWPARRDAETFLEWFDLEVHDIVVDLGDEPLATEELG